MKIRFQKSLINNILYFAITIYFSYKLLSLSFFSVYIPGFFTNFIPIVTIILLLINEISLKKLEAKSILAFSSVIFSFAILLFLSNIDSYNFLYPLVIIYLLRNYNIDDVLNIALPIAIFIFFFVIVSSKLGIIVDYVEISQTRVRHYLGFTYSLFPSTVMLNITAMYIYKNRANLKLGNLILLFIAILWIFLQTNSRLTFMSSISILLIGMINFLKPNIWGKIQNLLLVFIPIYLIAPIISYLVAIRYKFMEDWILLLNNFLGNRIYLSYSSLSTYGFGLLGRKITWIGNALNASGQRAVGTYLYVDNLYLNLLQRYGLIFVTIYCIMLTIVMFRLYRQKHYFLFLIMFIFAIHGVIDDLTIHWHYHFFLILLNLVYSKSYKIS